MDDFWEQTGETVTIQQGYQPPQQSENNANDQEFDFSANQNQYISSSTQQQYGNMESTQMGSLSGGFEQDEVTRAIREEEQRIQQKLQEKANEQYELKQKRKQQAMQWLQNFFAKKQQQTQQRKRDNIEKQEQIMKDIKSSQTSQGWSKVSKSVDLKQSEYKGSKDINRMRESIIHKKEDQTSL